MRYIEGERILLSGEPSALVANPATRDGARNAAMNGLREVYVRCGLPQEDADIAVSNLPTDPEGVERLILIARDEIQSARELAAQVRETRKLENPGEIQTNIPLSKVRALSHEIASQGEIKRSIRSQNVR
jgi:hypothetical protein